MSKEDSPLVPVMGRRVLSAPKHDDAPPVEYMRLGDALTCTHDFDAHFCAYSVPELPHRLSREIEGQRDVTMVLLVGDVDDPVTHKEGLPAREEWRAEERAKMVALAADHPGLVTFDTRGGYRIVVGLAAPFTIRSTADRDRWVATYLGWCDALSRYGIAADRSCKDWTRIYRLPNVTREKVGPVTSQCTGDPWAIGEWPLEFPTPAPAEPQAGPATSFASPKAVERPHEDEWLSRVTMSTRVKRAREYARNLDAAVSGDSSHADSMRVATAIVRGFALDPKSAIEVLQPWNSRCEPPWSDSELRHKLDEAARIGAMAWGEKLRAPEPSRSEATTRTDGAPTKVNAPRLIQTIDAVAIAEPLAPIKWVCKPLRVAEETVSLFAGYGYSRKTLALQALALSVAAGSQAFGAFATRQGRVVHLDYEQGSRLTRERYQRLARPMGINLATLNERLRLGVFPDVKLSDGDAEDVFCKLFDGTDLAIIDSLRAGAPDVDENSSDVRRVVDVVGRAAKRVGSAVILVHHARKPRAEEQAGRYSIRGSSAIFDAFDSIWTFAAEKGAPTLVSCEKDRLIGDEPEAFFLDSEDVAAVGDERWGLRVVWGSASAVKAANADAQARAEADQRAQHEVDIQQALLALPNATWTGSKTALAQRVGGRKSEVLAALGALISVGAIERRYENRQESFRWQGQQ